MASNTLSLTVEVDNRPGVQSVQQFNSSLSGIERAALKASQQANQGFQSIERQAVRASASIRQSFSGLSNLLGGIVGAGGLAAIGTAAVGIATDFQTARIGLQAFLGDADKANALFRDIQAFAEKSPFEFKDLLEGSNRLLAFNFEAKEILPTLRATSAAMGALGGDRGKLNDLITALGQIKSAGKITGEEMRQLRNAGIPALDFLAKGFGKTTAEIDRAVRDGIVPADAAIRALLNGMTERFGAFDAAVSSTTKVALSNFKDALGRLADESLQRFLPDLTRFVKDLTREIERAKPFLIDMVGQFRSFAGAVVDIGIAFATYKIAPSVAEFVRTLATSGLTKTPWGAIAAAMALVVAQQHRLTRAWQEFQSVKLDDNIIRQLLRDGKTAEELEKLGFSAQRVRDALGEIRQIEQQGTFNLGEPLVRIVDAETAKKKKLEEFSKNAEEEAKKLAAAQKSAADLLRDAQRDELSGLARIREERNQALEQYGKTKKAIEDINAAFAIRERIEQRKIDKEQRKVTADRVQEIEAFRRARADARVEFADETGRIIMESIDARQQQELTAIQQSRDAQLAGLSQINAVTAEQKVALEQRKLEIEIEYLQKSQALQRAKLVRETEDAIQQARIQAQIKGVSEELLRDRIDVIRAAGAEREAILSQNTTAEIEAARQAANSRSVQIIREQNESVFASYKQGFESVFDALTTRTRSFGDTMKNLLRAAFLTPLREFASNLFATLLTGQRAAAGAGTTRQGGIGGILGSIFGGGGGFGGLGGFGFPGAPGGTVGIAGPVGQIGGGGIPIPLRGGPTNALGGLFGGLSGLRDFLGFGSTQIMSPSGISFGLPNTALAGGRLGALLGSPAAALGGGLLLMNGIRTPGLMGSAQTIGGSTLMGISLLSKLGGAIGGKLGGGLLGAGGGLVFDGLRRGGVAGLFETIGGGALIGAKFGGPIGAAIGAGVGAVAGIIRLFIKGAQDKAREKIKALYGVDIKDKGLLKQIVDMAKQGFGGNMDVAIRSQQVKDLIELYAMATGQDIGRLGVGKGAPISLMQSGGIVTQAPVYYNGSALPAPPRTAAAAPAGGSATVVLQLDGPTTERVLQGQAVEVLASNPRVAVDAVNRASKGNYGRFEQSRQLFSPGLVRA